MDKNNMYYEHRHEKMYRKDVGTLTEYPFFYEGMTVEEFEDEKEYYWKVPFEDTRTYKPLWKQRQEKEGKD